MSQHHREQRMAKKKRESFYRQIHKRDRGFCKLCHKDNDALFLTLLDLLHRKDVKGVEALAEAHKITTSRLADAFHAKFGRVWDYDHIIPLTDGGTWELSNIRTLCVECHLQINKIYYYLTRRQKIPKTLLPFYDKYMGKW